jgi:hypothetical protein
MSQSDYSDSISEEYLSEHESDVDFVIDIEYINSESDFVECEESESEDFEECDENDENEEYEN